jgi:hypothetical protein
MISGLSPVDIGATTVNFHILKKNPESLACSTRWEKRLQIGSVHGRANLRGVAGISE